MSAPWPAWLRLQRAKGHLPQRLLLPHHGRLPERQLLQHHHHEDGKERGLHSDREKVRPVQRDLRIKQIPVGEQPVRPGQEVDQEWSQRARVRPRLAELPHCPVGSYHACALHQHRQ